MSRETQKLSNWYSGCARADPFQGWTVTSLRLKSRIQRLERQMRTEGRGTASDQKLLSRFQAALKREAENRENEARQKQQEAA